MRIILAASFLAPALAGCLVMVGGHASPPLDSGGGEATLVEQVESFSLTLSQASIRAGPAHRIVPTGPDRNCVAVVSEGRSHVVGAASAEWTPQSVASERLSLGSYLSTPESGPAWRGDVVGASPLARDLGAVLVRESDLYLVALQAAGTGATIEQDAVVEVALTVAGSAVKLHSLSCAIAMDAAAPPEG